MPYTPGKSASISQERERRSASSSLPLSERQQVALVIQMTSHNQSGESERNGRGETPLHLAAIKGDVTSVSNLLDHGADPNIPDFAGWRPLHEACNHGWLEVAKLLISRGADVNAKGFQDDTPLHDAAINNHIPLLKLLIEHGADANVRNKKGKSPGDVAASPEANRILSHHHPSYKRLSDQQSEGQGSGEKGERKSPSLTDQQLTTPSPSSSAETDSNMRRLPTKEKVSGSPRVTLRLHPIKEKKTKTQDSSYDNSCEVGMKEESGVVEGEEEGKEGDGEGDATNNPSDRTSPLSESGGTKRPASGNLTEKRTAGATDQTKPQQVTGSQSQGKPQQISGSKRSSGDTQESDDSETRRKRRKENNDQNEQSSVESPGPKVPPLKIVLGGVSNSGGGSGGEEQTRKSGGSRLPYVVQPPAPPSSTEETTVAPAPAPTSTTPPLSGETGTQQNQPSQDNIVSQDSPQNPQSNEGQQDPNGKENHKRVLRSHRSGNGSSGHSSPAGLDVGSPRSQVSPLPSELPLQSDKEGPAEEEPAKEDSSSGQQSAGPQTQTGTAGSTSASSAGTNELHPRKRKLKQPKDTDSNGSQPSESALSPSSQNNAASTTPPASEAPPPANCYQLYLNIRKQIDRRRKGLFPVQPKPPQGFKDYLMNRCTYVLAGNANNRIPPPNQTPPPSVVPEMKEMFLQQEKERYRLRTQHVIEKEKLVLSVEQEILRVHGRAARALANQALPFSACTILRDEEVYSPFSAEQEEKERNARSRYNGRLFLSWLQDVDDKWEKIKEAMLLRHHNEAESLHAVQKMDWTWKLKEIQPTSTTLQDQPTIDETHVPMVHVSDDFDLLPT